MNEPTQEQIGDVLTAIAATADAELMALEDTELAEQWYWRARNGKSGFGVRNLVRFIIEGVLP